MTKVSFSVLAFVFGVALVWYGLYTDKSNLLFESRKLTIIWGILAFLLGIFALLFGGPPSGH